MSGLIGKAMRLAKTKQGQEALDKVQKYAKSPEAKERIEDIKGKVSGKKDDADASPTPAAKPPAATTPEPAPAPVVDASATPKPDPNAPSGGAGTSGGTSSAGA